MTSYELIRDSAPMPELLADEMFNFIDAGCSRSKEAQELYA